MNKIFLDCGGNKGQSIIRFKKSKEYSNDFKLYSFEPVPFLAKKYSDMSGVNVLMNAVWIYDGEVAFYFNKKSSRPEGSTLMKSKVHKKIEKKPHMVKCIDFSKWIMDNFSKDDYIILKVDIEGAEYEVFEKMLTDGSINYIDKAYVEFHYDKIHMEKSKHDELIKKLKNIDGFELLPEMASVIK